ncbi:gamma-mobile-trio protein GmtX [Pseudomonas sp.]|jgi:hypothetical protein|uniref:gamma-mobile-trio protein GmtX n=1 Tax=Pseudomonas sp. TaxID=306 RepID=UPI002ED8D8BF
MNSNSAIHPDEVFTAIKAKGGRPRKLKNLTDIHEICRKHSAQGKGNLTISIIGRLCEANGIIKARALYNAPSSDYRALIEAWRAYSGPAVVMPKHTLSSHEYLTRIEDPAIRSIMQTAIMERDKLRAQINIIKSNTQIIVDRRPNKLSAEIPDINSGGRAFGATSLSDSERQALIKATSTDFLDQEGWHEGSYGEILNSKGRILFDVGFMFALRKILEP